MKLLSGGLTEGNRSRSLPLLFGGEGEDICGGADIDLRDLRGGRVVTIDLRARARVGDGRTGEEDSAPD